MAERLERIARETNLDDNPYFNEQRYQSLKRAPPSANPVVRFRVESTIAEQALLAGYSDDAIVRLERLREIARKEPGAREFLPWIEGRLAIAHLRKGEQANCVSRHSPDSCLFPISGSGVHVDQAGSRAAIQLYEARLASDPDDMTARWVLNVAYMTVGEYPAGVPKKWLIPPSLFASERPFVRFYDIASAVGVATAGLAGGVAEDDFDGDGLLDLVVSSMGVRDQIRYLHNDGDGRFSDRTMQSGLTGLHRGLNINHADYDNDGDPDVLVLRGGWAEKAGHVPNSLLRNDGGGHFTDVTEDAGLLSEQPTQTGVWGDFDNDGWLDLFIGNEKGHGHEHPAQLYRNNRNGTFTEMASKLGVAATGYIKGVTAGDYDNDGWLDLYISRLDGPNTLYRNREGKGFEDVTKKAGVAQPERSFPTWFFDYDNDGDLDLFVSGYKSSAGDIARDYLGKVHEGSLPRLYRNKGNGTFADVTKKVGLDTVLYSMGCNFGDLDNDGWLDFYIGTGEPSFEVLIPNRMFKGDGKRFYDVTVAGGFGHLQKGHGVAFGDLDNDGDQDVFAVIGGAYSGDVFFNALYENPGNSNGFVQLELQGVKTNRAAIGARLQVHVRGPGGARTIYDTVSTGGSFGSAPLRREIGLGNATSIDRVEVFWPVTGVTEKFTSIAPGNAYRLVEGSGAATLVKRPSFRLARP